MLPAELALPYEQWTVGQWETILEASLTDKKYLIIEAPTGSGKSAVALAVNRLAENRRAEIVTGTKQLQEQYANLGPFQAMGRNNFPCLIDTVTADIAACTNGYECEHKKPALGPAEKNGRTGKMTRPEIGPPECPYYAQKWYAKKAPESVYNYAYWLAIHNYDQSWPHPNLVVFDEAHELEDQIRRFASVKLLKSHVAMLREKGVWWPAADLDFDGWQEWARATLDEIAIEAQEYTKRKELGRQEKRFATAITTVYFTCLAITRKGVSDDNWVYNESIFGIEFQPVWVSDISQRYAFKYGERFILMSATILDPKMFASQLGIPEDQVEYLPVASTFPVANRPLYYQPVTKIKASDQQSLRLLAKEVSRIAARYPGRRGLVHTGSYKIASFLATNVACQSRVLTHDTKSRVQQLAKFRATTGAILISPSVGTGVDLPYDLCEWQIIAKLPFPDQGDPQVKKRMKESAPGVPNQKGQNWYNWTTLCNIVQAYGRGMRAIDDRCDTYLLDGNWQWFRHTVKHILPAWFRDAIINPRPTSGDFTADIMAQIRGES